MPVERIKNFPFPHIKSIEDMEKWGKELHRCLTEDQYERAMDFNDITLDSLVTNSIYIRNTGELRFYDNGNYVGFEPPALSADQIWVLPNADGPANEVLGTDNSGNLIWRTHDELAAYDANDHIDHTSVSISGGGLISGGGTIASDRTLTLTEATIEVAIDTLANLTSIQGQTVTFSGSLNVEGNSNIDQDLTTDSITATLGRLGIPAASTTNLLYVAGAGATSGGGTADVVTARFKNTTAAHHSAIAIDALTGYDSALFLSENGAFIWGIRNDASATDKFQVRYQAGAANRTDFEILNTGAVNIPTGALTVTSTLSSGAHTLTGNSTSKVANAASANREILQLRALSALSDGAGINLYGDNDNTAPGMIKMWTGNTSALEIGASTQTAAFSGALTWSGGGSANANTAYTHVSSCGADHGYLDQSVISGANVTFGTIGSADITVDSDLVLSAGSITSVGATINFGDENLVTTGTLTAQNTTLSTTTSYKNITNYAYKTAGVSNYADHLLGIDTYIKMDDGSNGIGNMVATNSVAWHTQGDLGDAGHSRDALGLQGYCDLDGGKIWGNAYGCYFFVDQESGHEVTSNVYALRLFADLDGTVGGTSYMLHLLERSGVDYGFYQDGTAINLFGGNTGIGQSTFGTNATKTSAWGTGVAPTTSPADCFQMYSADIASATGKAGAHFRDEAGNIVSIGSGGVLMTGTARVIKDLWIDAGGIKAPGANPANEIAHGNLETPAWQFGNEIQANEETISASLKLPNDMDMTVAPILCVGWSTTTTDPGDQSEQVEWQLEYLYSQLNETTAGVAEETLYATGTASTMAEGLMVTQFAGINTPHANDVCMHTRIKRLSSASTGVGNETDTIADDVELHGLVLLYSSNKLGTAST